MKEYNSLDKRLVSFVIDNWNGNPFLAEYLDPFVAQNIKDMDIALLNNDAKVDPEWMPILLKKAESCPPNIGMWASKIFSYDNLDIIDNVGLLMYPDGLGRGKGDWRRRRAIWPNGRGVLFELMRRPLPAGNA